MSAPHLASDVLDRYVLGALAPDALQAADAHLAGCERCQGDLSALKADMQHFNQFVLPRTLEPVRARVERARSPFALQRWIAPAFAMAGVMTVALIAVSTGSKAPAFDAAANGIKGGPILQIFSMAKDATAPVKLDARAHVAPGDRLQFVSEPAGNGYLLVVSLDGRGEVSAFWPPEARASGQVPPNKSPLDGAIELDASPGPEHVFAFFSRQPLPFDAVAKAVKAQPQHPAVDGASEPVQFTLEKAAR